MTNKITKITWNFQPNFDGGWGKYYLAQIGEPVKIVHAGKAQIQEDQTKIKEIHNLSTDDIIEYAVILENGNKYIIYHPSEVFIENI